MSFRSARRALRTSPYNPAPKVRDFAERWATAKEKNGEAAMREIRQRLHDRLPAKAVGPVGQQIVDSLYDVIAVRDVLELRFLVTLRFEDPDGNKWDLLRTMKFKMDPDCMADAEQYLFDMAIRLSEEEIAQLAMVLT